jgi:hypothetical protein
MDRSQNRNPNPDRKTLRLMAMASVIASGMYAGGEYSLATPKDAVDVAMEIWDEVILKMKSSQEKDDG